MKMKTNLLSRAVFAATMLYAPAFAAAQETKPPAQPEPTVTNEADPTVAEEGEIVVQGRFIPEPMRETSEVATFLSSADLARTGDDNAAAALTRLSGLSVVSDRFVYVRGLGDRYSSALLNGSPLPSPEPLRRQVPLDLFPSNILSGAVVQKTFSPNYPGEFGGGIIDLKTLRLPSKTFLTVKAGTGANSESTAQDGVFYYGSDSDWTGFDDGLRDIPGPLSAAIGRRKRIDDSNFTSAELERIGESLVNAPLTVVQRGDRPADFEGEVTAGTSIDIDKYNIGLVGVFGFDTQWRTRNAIRNDVAGNVVDTSDRVTTTTNDIVANFFGSASLSWEDNEITLSSLVVRSSTKEAQISRGFNINVSGADPLNPVDNNLREQTAWYERQLANVQLAGEHKFDALEIDWRTAFAQSTRDAPYERSVSYGLVNGEAIYSGLGGLGNSIRFSELTDEIASAGVDARYTIPLSETREMVISGGAAYSNTVRTSELFQFGWTGPRGVTPQDVLRARVDFLFSPDNISPQRWVLNEFTGPDDSYKARLTNTAYYAAVDAEVIPLVRAAIGLRYEDATQVVRTFNRFGQTTSRPVNLQNDYLLPSATLTWNFAEDLQLRLGYSQTIARPQFRELAFTPFLDPDTDRVYRGNPFLTDSEFKNYDARVEYYFGRDQFVTGGIFYKEIENPIEEVVFKTDRILTNFLNAPKATLTGAEVEFRTRFDSPIAVPFFDNAEVLFGINYTYTKAEVEAGAGATVVSPIDFRTVAATQFGLDGTPLQGTPENIANIMLGLETDTQQLTLLIGWVDERVLRRGLGSVKPVLEDPGTNVDLVFRQDFKIGEQEFTLGIAGRNLLGSEHDEFQNNARGRTSVNTYDRGQSASISLTAKY